MKLFTTITSERGKPVTKSGNEYIDIDILVGSTTNNRTLARLTIRPNERGYGLYDHTDELLAEVTESELKTPTHRNAAH